MQTARKENKNLGISVQVPGLGLGEREGDRQMDNTQGEARSLYCDKPAVRHHTHHFRSYRNYYYYHHDLYCDTFTVRVSYIQS